MLKYVLNVGFPNVKHMVLEYTLLPRTFHRFLMSLLAWSSLTHPLLAKGKNCCLWSLPLLIQTKLNLKARMQKRFAASDKKPSLHATEEVCDCGPGREKGLGEGIHWKLFHRDCRNKNQPMTCLMHTGKTWLEVTVMLGRTQVTA